MLFHISYFIPLIIICISVLYLLSLMCLFCFGHQINGHIHLPVLLCKQLNMYKLMLPLKKDRHVIIYFLISPCHQNHVHNCLHTYLSFFNPLGTVPAPILFGAIFDATCRLWQNKCDENGSCWIYDEERLSKDLFTLILVLSLLSASLYFLALVCYKKPRTETDASTCLVYSVGEDGGRTNRQTDLHTLHREPGIYLVGHDTPVVHPFHIETSI